MPLPESIRRAWTDTDYRVRLARGGHASIRCGQPLPAPLLAMLEHANGSWGYVTAWNPGGVLLPRASNRIRQCRLRDELKADGARYLGAIGVGIGDWREFSLFVPDISFARLDELARHFGQLSVVRGRDNGPAELNELI